MESVEVLSCIMERKPHVLAISYPAQGHLWPLMKLSHWISSHGIKVTFVSPECIHARLLAVMAGKGEEQNQIEMVSIPDGLEPGDHKNDKTTLAQSMLRVMPGHLEDLIKNINLSDDEKITCVIADPMIGWALEIAERMGIKRAMFWPSMVGGFALALHIPKLIETGVIDDNGIPTKNEMIPLSPDVPAVSTAEFIWTCPGNPILQKSIFGSLLPTNKVAKSCNWLLCNSFYELDPSVCDLIPNLLPIGPLPPSNLLGQSAGNFWPEDSTCLSWLDKQPARSVIYVAFGSVATFSQHQYEELALGLELSGQPFLWVVRSDLFEYPDGFTERVANFGKMVEWAPQDKVLAHPSIACFFTHCGWNSALEGLSMGGVPFLCLPGFADHFHNKSYICDVYKVGLGLNPDENGIISRLEIKSKIEKLLSDENIRTNALKLKEMARKSVSEGGSSFKNFKTFIEQLKC